MLRDVEIEVGTVVGTVAQEPGAGGIAAKLKQLNELRQEGAITAEEYTAAKLKALQDTVLSLNLHMDKLKYEMLALESKFPAQQQQQQQQQAPRAESDRLDFSIRA